MFKKNLRIILLANCLVLTACAPGPHLHVTTAIGSLGMDLDPGMTNRNLIATVGFDEGFVGTYPTVARTTAYLESVEPGTPEHLYRMAHLNLSHLKGFGWYADGQLAYATTGAIPDHIGKLKAWDLVEFRSTGTHRTLKDFSNKQEGNIIVRVLCRKADADYEKCRDGLPQVRKYPNGPTGTPYPTSAKEYGYTFTPAYDDKGKPARVIPEYSPKS